MPLQEGDTVIDRAQSVVYKTEMRAVVSVVDNGDGKRLPWNTTGKRVVGISRAGDPDHVLYHGDGDQMLFPTDHLEVVKAQKVRKTF